MGPGEQLLQPARRAGKARQRVLPWRRRRGRADRQEQDVLLVRHRELPRHSVAQRIHGVSDGCRTNGRLLEAYQRERAAGRHLRSSDQAAVSRKHHPGKPYQRGCCVDRQLLPAAGRGCRQRHQQLHAHGRDQQQVPAGIHDQGRAQVHRRGVAERLLPLQPDRRARCQLLRGRVERRNALRRSQRLPPEAAAADPGDQQQLGGREQLSALPAFRDDAIPRQLDDDDRFRPVDPGILAVLPRARRPDRRSQVSQRIDLRLQQLRRDHALVPHLQVVEHQRQLLDARRPAHVQVRRRLPSDWRRLPEHGRLDRPLPVRQGVHVRDRAQQQQPRRRKRLRQLPARLPVGELGAAEHDDADDAARDRREVLRRLRPGRLAGELEVHAELRPAHRARDRDERSQQQLHRRLRSAGGQRALGGDDSRRSHRRHAGTLDRRRADVRWHRRQSDVAGQSPGRAVVAAGWRGLLDHAEPDSARRLRHLLGAVELSGAEQRQQQLWPGRLHEQHRRPADGREPERQPDEPVPERPRGAARQLDWDA